MVTNDSIKTLLQLRLNMLKKQGFLGITVDDLEHIFKSYIWKDKQYKHLNEVVTTIFDTTDAMIIRWFTLDSTLQSHKASLEDIMADVNIT